MMIRGLKSAVVAWLAGSTLACAADFEVKIYGTWEGWGTSGARKPAAWPADSADADDGY